MQVNSDKSIFDAELEYGHHLVVKWAGRLASGMQYFSQEPRGLVAEITEGDSFADLRASSSTSHLLKPLSQVGAVSSSCLLEALGNLTGNYWGDSAKPAKSSGCGTRPETPARRRRYTHSGTSPFSPNSRANRGLFELFGRRTAPW